ncbi:hypothetical protein QVD17_28895 [Tagetes erecta]|uniref:Uncharacterized protein n=1 Tax=Tagetes erecta TaxID=13708 RepID=A0AAD8NKT7_TARER|nr:hypothetical protein QVD17_28895 [Tagetes erecta]
MILVCNVPILKFEAMLSFRDLRIASKRTNIRAHWNDVSKRLFNEPKDCRTSYAPVLFFLRIDFPDDVIDYRRGIRLKSIREYSVIMKYNTITPDTYYYQS